MSDKELEDQLSAIVPSERVLLLSHCMRPSQTCPAKFNKEGLQCLDDCRLDCVLLHVRKAAIELGYKGICIAAGGAQALRFVKERKPQGIIAVACDKELEEGVQSVAKLAGQLVETPTIIVVPLLKDGCVDTEVDEAAVLRAIRLGTERGEG
jgi:uncharacterized protein